MSISKKIAYNSVVQIVGKILGTIFGLLAVAWFARYLGSNGFGAYTTATAFASMFAIAADLGLTLVTSQMINKTGQDRQKVIANLMTFRLVTALLLLALAPVIGYWMPYSQEVKLGIWLAAGAFLFVSLNQVFVAIFQKHLRTDYIALAEVLSRAALALGAWLVARYDWGLTGVLWSMLIANAFSFGLHWYFARALETIGLAFNRLLWWEIIKRSWPLLTTIVLNLVYLKADIVLLSVMDTNETVGLYGAAYKVVDVLVSLPYMFAGLVLPVLVAAWSESRKHDYRLTWQNFFDYTAIIAWPLVLGGIALATPIIALIAGSEFLAAGPLLAVLMLAVMAVFISCIFTHTMISWEQQSKLIGLYILTAVTSLPVYYFGIKLFSAYGAAWATVYSETLIMVGSAWIASRRLGFAINWSKFIKSGTAALLMALAIFGLRNLATANVVYLLLAVLIGAGLYFWLLSLLGVFTGQDWRRLLGKKAGAPIVENL